MVKVLIVQKGHRNLAQTYLLLFYTLSRPKYTGIGFMKWTSSSTVSRLSFVYIQSNQTITLFPMMAAGKLVLEDRGCDLTFLPAMASCA